MEQLLYYSDYCRYYYYTSNKLASYDICAVKSTYQTCFYFATSQRKGRRFLLNGPEFILCSTSSIAKFYIRQFLRVELTTGCHIFMRFKKIFNCKNIFSVFRDRNIDQKPNLFLETMEFLQLGQLQCNIGSNMVFWLYGIN